MSIDSADPGMAGALAARVMARACEAWDAGTAPPGSERRDFGWHFIRRLHDAFEAEAGGTPCKVFTRTVPSGFDTGGKELFEFLFDLTVIGWGEAARAPGPRAETKHLPILGRPLWQVESEIHRNTRAVAFDLGKLMQGAAPNKLLITARRADPEAFNRFLEAALRPHDEARGNLFVGYVPNYKSRGTVREGRSIRLGGLWRLSGGRMLPVVAWTPGL